VVLRPHAQCALPGHKRQPAAERTAVSPPVVTAVCRIPAHMRLPVRVSEGAADAIGSASSTGSIHIKFGKARIRIEGKADAQALNAVLERLLR